MDVIDPAYVRPIPPRSPFRNNGNPEGAETEEVSGDFQVNAVVDAYLRDGWRIGVVNTVIVDGEMKKYRISFESPNPGSQMRLHVDGIESRSKLRSQKTPMQESLDKNVTNDERGVKADGFVRYSRGTRRVILVGEDVDEILQSSLGLENSGSKGSSEDSLGLQQEMINKETCETRDGNSQLNRKRGRPSTLLFQSPNGSLEESSTDEAMAASSPDMVNDGQTSVWPFIKRSPVWSTLESLELFQNLSQNPRHFSPLRKIREDLREGLAIAHMVTFTNVIERTKTLQWTDPIKPSLEILVGLEAHGFDVGPARARLQELLSKIEEAGRHENEMKEAEKQVDKFSREITVIDEDIHVLERRLREAEAMKKVKYEEVMVVRSRLQLASKRIADSKLGFEELVWSPL